MNQKLINHISIKNFKSIADLELDLGRVNVFIGENGCGKTNILEGVAFGSLGLRYINEDTKNSPLVIRDSYTNIDLAAKGIRNTLPELIPSNFDIQNTEEFQIKYFKQNGLISHLSGNADKKLLVEYDSQEIEQLENFELENVHSKSESGYKEIQIKGSVTIQKRKDGFIIFAPENYFLRNFEDEGAVEPIGIRGEGLFKHLVELYKENPEVIKQLNEKLQLIDWFGGFEIPNDLMFTEKRINLKDKYLEHLDYFDQRSSNEGFLFLLFYFTLFLSPHTPKFFAIDNIDNALNPKLCAKLIQELVKIAKENGKQVLLTTHNPAVLDGLDLEDDEQRLFTVYRNLDGETTARRVKPSKKIEGVESIRLSEAFIRGYIGGLPDNF